MKLPVSLAADIEGEIAYLRLARPAKRNALNDQMIDGIEHFFRDLPAAVKVAILSGEGEHFSAGLDLNELTETSAPEAVAHSRRWHRAFQEIEFGRVPVIAVLHGAIVGGGLELASACHIRVAERSAYYGLPEGQRGIFVGGGSSVRLPKLIGVSRMVDMMLTGRVYGAEDGLSLGLSQYLVDDGEGMAMAKRLAGKIAANAPLTNFALIQALPRIASAEPGTGYLLESLMAAVAQDGQEAKERLRDFLEKRAPKVTKD